MTVIFIVCINDSIPTIHIVSRVGCLENSLQFTHNYEYMS